MRGSFFLFFLLESVAFGYTQTTNLTCHQCTPLDEGVNCASVTSNSTLVTCTNGGFSDVIVSCFSAFYDYNNATTPGIGWDRTNRSSETGVYRGCAQRHHLITDFCAYQDELLSMINAKVISCRTCDEENCNTHRFTSQGHVVDNGTKSIVVSIYIVLISMLCQVVSKNFQ